MAPTRDQEVRPARLEERPSGRERRSHARYAFPGAMLDFGFPGPLGEHHRQPLKDLSLGGIAFYFPRGCCLEKIRVGGLIYSIILEIAGARVQLDMLVMRVAPAGDDRMVCGGLAYWKTLDDFERIRELAARAEKSRS